MSPEEQKAAADSAARKSLEAIRIFRGNIATSIAAAIAAGGSEGAIKPENIFINRMPLTDAMEIAKAIDGLQTVVDVLDHRMIEARSKIAAAMQALNDSATIIREAYDAIKEQE